jgi:DNA replication and repair protein RecF
MIIRHLTLQHFRTYTRLRQEFAPGLNVLVGDNGEGKTNLLEAVYLLATTKSFRGSRDVELIRWDQTTALATGEVLREKANDLEVEIALTQGHKKNLLVNTVRATRAGDFIGQLKVVAFSAADLETIRGEPARRRRFLDLEISQLSPSYCHTLAYYRKVVEQRNRLLKSLRYRGGAAAAADDSLAAWTDQLVQHGARLVERRRQFLERLGELAQPIHAQLTEERESLVVAFEPSFRLRPGDESPEGAFREALGTVRQEELRRQMSLIGPHRDDVLFLVNGRDVRVYGSQGQQRTVALSLKLAEVLLMRDLAGEPPVCVLDDVFSELDARRRSHLFDVTLGQCQTFISTTDRSFLPAEILKQASVWEVRQGALWS